jgi:thiol-disulfide isomerase/thioredoxin
MQKIFFIAVFISLFFTSCYQDDEVTEKIGISASQNEQKVYSEVTFNVVTLKGEDVTDESTFFVNGVQIPSNSFTSSEEKTYNVQARYNGLTSNLLPIKFSFTLEGYVKRALVEDYTGTWCGNCPRVTHALDLIKQQTDKIVEVAIHRGTPAQNEPYLFDATVLEQLFQVSGYPAARINRTGIWSAQQQNNLNQVISQTQGAIVKAGVAMENTVANGTINLKVNVGFLQDYSNLKLVVYVLENGLIYDQVNYTPFYGGVDPIPNFVHNHTLRSCLTNLLGDAIPNESAKNGTTYVRNFSVPVPSNVSNVSKLEFVAFVIGADNRAINSRRCLVNATQGLELL